MTLKGSPCTSFDGATQCHAHATAGATALVSTWGPAVVHGEKGTALEQESQQAAAVVQWCRMK